MPGQHGAPRLRNRLVARTLTAATWLLGAWGLMVALWLVVSLVTGARIVIFETGSMGPAMPAGSAAISLPAPARDLRVGDVVTVARDGGLPVTHRIKRLGDMSGTGRDVVLQGDANAGPDPFPYHVTAPLRVLTSVPGLGAVVRATRTPALLAGATVIAAALVLSALWPAGRRTTGATTATSHRAAS